MTNQGIVHVVDDDPAIRSALTASLENRGLIVQSYESAETFLNLYKDDQAGCLVLDIRMPGINGLELQQILIKKNYSLPIIFVTGHGDVPMSVKALKNGAVDFLEKPYRQDILQQRIEQALEQSCSNRKVFEEINNYMKCYERLTPREKQVMEILVAEYANISNKKIAKKLEISPRTVENHREKIMLKMQVSSLLDLVKISERCNP